MHRAIAKHAERMHDEEKDKSMIHFMHKEMKYALKDFEAGKDYMFHLGRLHEMIEHYHEAKGTSPEFHKKDKDY